MGVTTSSIARSEHQTHNQPRQTSCNKRAKIDDLRKTKQKKKAMQLKIFFFSMTKHAHTHRFIVSYIYGIVMITIKVYSLLV